MPFEEDDSKTVEWAVWAEKLKPLQIRMFMPVYPPSISSSVTVSEEDKNTLVESEFVSRELYKELNKLSKALFILDSIVKAVEPDAIHKLYKDLKARCEDTYIHTKRDLSKMSLYDLSDYKGQLLLSVFEKVVKEKNEEDKRNKWKEMTNMDGVPDARIVGRYIYEHRWELELYDLREYFEYERVANFMYQIYNKELNDEDSSFDLTDIITFGTDKDKLKKVIQTKFIPKFQIKNRWFCAWRVLKDKRILINGATIEDFTDLMTHWFPKKFTKEDLKYYKDTCLAKTSREQWEKEEYIADIKTHPKASSKAFENFNTLCIELEEVLKEKKLGII